MASKYIEQFMQSTRL